MALQYYGTGKKPLPTIIHFDYTIVFYLNVTKN